MIQFDGDFYSEIMTLKGTRNGKNIEMRVRVEYCGGETPDVATCAWIKKENGKPFYGSTGYWRCGGLYKDLTVIKSYRGKVMVENVELIKD